MILCSYRPRPYAPSNGRLMNRLSPRQIRRERDTLGLPDSRYRACNKATNATKIRSQPYTAGYDKFGQNRTNRIRPPLAPPITSPLATQLTTSRRTLLRGALATLAAGSLPAVSVAAPPHHAIAMHG